MRVIGGEFRSRRLKSVPGLDTRPTPDRLREALFNVLAPRLAGAVFFDAYAGTGAVGIEALSRGAARSIFVDIGRAAIKAIEENLKSLAIEDRAQVVSGRAASAVGRYRPDIVFADPPYNKEREYGAMLEALAETPPPLFVVQHESRLALPERHGRLRRVRILRQGDNSLSFYEPE